jgi:predicted RNA-binding protein associated with RNAse of E/G family
MKQKQANRPNWSRIIQSRYHQEYVKTEFFEGYVTYLLLDSIVEPLIVRYETDELCIVDHGYTWIMIFPVDSHYCLTMMINKDYEVLQWYFDIIYSLEMSPEGIPVINDLYLDIIYLPNGKIIIKDTDELNNALNDRSISKKVYDLAVNAGAKLQKEIEVKSNSLVNNSYFFVERLKTI